MSDKKAADILRNIVANYQPRRANGKSESELLMIIALNKAIRALERTYDKTEPVIKPKDGECRCVCCGRVVKDDKIFPQKADPKKGLCFDCY